MTDAVIYVRISKDSAALGLGVTRQREDATSLAQARGWTITEVLVDNDLSAYKKAIRPGFERVLELLAQGRAPVIITWSWDRITRDRHDTVRLIEAGQQAESIISLVRGSDLDMSTPSGRFTADMLAAFARSEVELKADRQIRASQQAAEAGRWHGGTRPFGYEADGITIRPAEAGAIGAAAQWLLDGVPSNEIARRWNETGVRTTKDADWTGRSVSQMMRRARNAGLRQHRGEVVGPAEWPEIIDPDTWHSVLAVLNDPGRRHKRHDSWLLTGGIARCGICRAPMQAGTTSGMKAGGGSTHYSAYRCSATAHLIRRRERVEDHVTEEVLARLSRPDAAELLTAPAPDTSGITDELDTLRQRSAHLADAYADGTVTLQQLARANTRMTDRMAELERELQASAPTLHRGLEVVRAPDVRKAWQDLTLEAQKSVIGALATVWIEPVGRGRRHDPGVRMEWLS